MTTKKTQTPAAPPKGLTHADSPEVVLDLLGLVMEHPPTLDEIATWWSADDRALVADWAGREHLCASDNDDLLRLPMPDVLARLPTMDRTDTVVTSSTTTSDTDSPVAPPVVEEEPPAPRHEEWHVTVEGDPIKWWNFLTGENGWPDYNGVDVKPLYIELADHRLQLLSAMAYDPSKPVIEGDDDATTFIQACEAAGFKVVRIKHEVSALRDGEVPLYYEAHVKLDGPFRVDRPGASRDLYRRERWYRTHRSIAPFDVATFVERSVSQSKPSELAGFEYEAVLIDTNPSLDTGWV